MTTTSATASARSRALRVLRALAALLVLTCAAPALAAPYRLQAGDQLRLSISELPETTTTSTIDIDGMITMPRLGTFAAAGQTLAELREAVGLDAAGKTVTLFSTNGDRLQVTLVGTEIQLEIVAYRPVYLNGDVARPGAIDYAPGLTVRAAVASAGGLSTAPSLFEEATLRVPRLQSELQTLSIAHAGGLARLWAVNATLARDVAGSGRPDPARAVVPRAVFDRFVALEQRRAELAIAQHEEERTSLQQRIQLVGERIALLSATMNNTQEALALEQEDLGRVAGLQDRGLASATRVSDARQALLVISSQMLTVQDSLAQFELTQQELQQDLARLDDEFERPLLAERAEILSSLWQSEARMASTRRELALNGSIGEVFGVTAAPSVTVAVVRVAGGAREELADVGLDIDLMPGDVVDLTVRYPYPDLSAGEPEPLDPAEPGVAAGQ